MNEWINEWMNECGKGQLVIPTCHVYWAKTRWRNQELFSGTVWTHKHTQKHAASAVKFCFKTCVAMKFVDDDDDDTSTETYTLTYTVTDKHADKKTHIHRQTQ